MITIKKIKNYIILLFNLKNAFVIATLSFFMFVCTVSAFYYYWGDLRVLISDYPVPYEASWPISKIDYIAISKEVESMYIIHENIYSIECISETEVTVTTLSQYKGVLHSGGRIFKLVKSYSGKWRIIEIRVWFS
jgi:hypothetical protein